MQAPGTRIIYRHCFRIRGCTARISFLLKQAMEINNGILSKQRNDSDKSRWDERGSCLCMFLLETSEFEALPVE
jgi:hypothetical protein